MGIENIIFLVVLIAGVSLFTFNARKIVRNIRLGRKTDRSDNKSARLKVMTRVALGQSKLMTRPIPGILHLFVYAGFIIINIEVLEILIDGVTGSHRALSFLGSFYTFLIASFEYLALAVLLGCLIFLIRRNIVRVRRLNAKELEGFPRTDANIILVTEILLMSAFLLMNAADFSIQKMNMSGMVDSSNPSLAHYAAISPAAFPISGMLSGMLEAVDPGKLIMLERFTWWFHIIGIMAFLNYLVISKHLHIILAFPNVYYSNLRPRGQFNNLESVTNEVKGFMDPSFTTVPSDEPPGKFGAKDVTDLTWKQLLDAYSCTECGRCTSACPANITGKKLSPRKIMMDTRDRLEEVGKNIDKNKNFQDDGKDLLSYITKEEIWACTSCNACVWECPVNIDPLSIIVDLRRYLVMEQSAAPQELNMMFSNVENNGAPWQFSPADRGNWTSEMNSK